MDLVELRALMLISFLPVGCVFRGDRKLVWQAIAIFSLSEAIECGHQVFKVRGSFWSSTLTELLEGV